MLEVELEVDRLRQTLEQHLDVAAVGWLLASRDVDTRPEDTTQLAVVRTFLRPVHVAARRIERDPDAPFRRIRPRSRIALARVHEGLDVRSVEIRSHHAHPLAIAPVELAVGLVEMALLRRERAAHRNDDRTVLPVEVGALDRAILAAGHTHVRPVHVAGPGVDGDAVGQVAAGGDDRLVGTVRLHRKDAASAEVENEQTAGRAGIWFRTHDSSPSWLSRVSSEWRRSRVVRRFGSRRTPAP